MPVDQRVWTGLVWRTRSGSPDIGPASPSRDSVLPIAGNASVNNGENVGPYTVTTWDNRFPGAGSNVISISTPGTYYGMTFWAQVKASVDGVVFRECRFAGPDPLTVGLAVGSTNLMGCIQNYGSNPRTIKFFDCKIDPSLWLTASAPGGARSKLDPYVLGLHGGQVEMRRTEIVNCQDAVNFIGTSSTTATIYEAQSHLFELCWLHKGYYINDFYDPRVNDGQPHCDGFQTNYGRNVTIRGCTLGGHRDPTGYLTWPGGYNSGDDMWNSAILLKQETANDVSKQCLNYLIDNNLLGGGNCTLNHAYVLARPNTWPDTVISNNKFLFRPTEWGYKLKGDGPGQTPYRNDVNALTTYVLKGTGITSTYTNNIVLETGLPVTISPGGAE